MTHYIVLRKLPRGDVPTGWEIIGHADASGPEQARKKVGGEEAGDWLVVPSRNANFIVTHVDQPPPKLTTLAVAPTEYLGDETFDGDEPVEVEEPVLA